MQHVYKAAPPHTEGHHCPDQKGKEGLTHQSALPRNPLLLVRQHYSTTHTILRLGGPAMSSNSNTESQRKWRHRRICPKWRNKKKPEKNSNETEISHLPDKEFKKLVIMMLNPLESWIEGLKKHFKQVRKRNKEWKVNNTITEMKTELEEIHSILINTEKWITWKTE